MLWQQNSSPAQSGVRVVSPAWVTQELSAFRQRKYMPWSPRRLTSHHQAHDELHSRGVFDEPNEGQHTMDTHGTGEDFALRLTLVPRALISHRTRSSLRMLPPEFPVGVSDLRFSIGIAPALRRTNGTNYNSGLTTNASMFYLCRKPIGPTQQNGCSPNTTPFTAVTTPMLEAFSF